VSYAGGDFASLDISDTCVITPGQPVELVRVYKGSVAKSTSGTLEKEGLLTLSGTTAALTEVDCEAVGGGASGYATSSNTATLGGAPGEVALVSASYADLPDVVSFTIGAGGARTSKSPPNVGGMTTIEGIVSAAGAGIDDLSPIDRPTGPGQGAVLRGTSDFPSRGSGGASNASIAELRLEGGYFVGGGWRQPAFDGNSASTPFQHGSGGGSGSWGGGNGGWPGGGGGIGTLGSSTADAGAGGAGAARFHVYAWEPVT
jgi:hypothetical protein